MLSLAEQGQRDPTLGINPPNPVFCIAAASAHASYVSKPILKFSSFPGSAHATHGMLRPSCLSNLYYPSLKQDAYKLATR